MPRPLFGLLAHLGVVLAFSLVPLACSRQEQATRKPASAEVVTKPSANGPKPQPVEPPGLKVEHKDSAMGTSLHFVAYTNARVDSVAARAAFIAATDEMRRLETILSEWRPETELSRVNRSAGEWTAVGDELFTVLEKSLWASRISDGTFDVTFQVMSDVWKFGTSQDAQPKLPERREIERRRKLIDYRRVELDAAARRVRLPASFRIGLGGIAKGYIVDRAAAVLRRAGLDAFLVQAGGDLYGAGKKPDGSAWVSGVQDPRGATGSFFAAIELEDHAFSTAGDYARSFMVGGRRYHHIIDPRTGYPASASRSVTVWATDAFTADAIDDAVFILGPEKGLKLVESLQGVGAVIVDRDNHVHVSQRLQGKVEILKPPTAGD